MLAAEESYIGEDASINLLDDPHPHGEEAVETLSLCDLPIYRDESLRDECSKNDQSSSFYDEDGFFEFFRDDLSASDSTYCESDNIIFCGKLIPCKQPSASRDTGKIKSEHKSAKKCHIRTKSRSFNNRKLSAVDAEDREFASVRRRGIKTFNSLLFPAPENSDYLDRKRSRNLDLQGERATIIESSPMKPRWFLFLFGSARLPKEMELSDMRTRQRRSRRSTMFRPTSEKEMVKGSSAKKGRGLWKLLKAMVIGRRNNDENGAVNNCFGSILLV